MATLFRSKNKEEVEFNQILKANQTFVYALCRRMLGDDTEAKDATQEVFIKVWAGLAKFNSDYKIRTWLYRITTNHCIDISRKGKVRLLETNVAEGINETSESVERDQLEEAIQKLTPALPTKQRAIFILAVMDGLSIKEISEILKESNGRVKSNLYYARKQMSQMLALYYGEKSKVKENEM